MTIEAITMPKWGLAMEEGTVLEWLLAEGDVVAVGAELVEIETSKITNVLEAQVTGPLRSIVAPVGQTLPVGALIAVIADAGDTDADIDAFVSDFQERFAQEAESAQEASGPQIVEVGGMSLAYEEVGTGDATPLVLVHGFGGDRNNWLFNQDALAEGRRVIMLDLPGHGASDKAIADASLKGMAQTVLDFADEIGLGEFHILGHSMGGAIALAVARQGGDGITSVVALCPAGLSSAVSSKYIDTFISAERRKGMKEAASMLFVDKSLVTRDLVNDLLKYKRLDGVQAALEALRDGAIADANAMAGDMTDIVSPVLAIVGEQDEVVPAPESVPEGVELVPLPLGHMAHMEDAKAVNAAILAFLKD